MEFHHAEVRRDIRFRHYREVAQASGRDGVAQGENLVEVETEKFTHPIEAPVDAIIETLLVEEGMEVEVGAVLATLRPLERRGLTWTWWVSVPCRICWTSRQPNMATAYSWPVHETQEGEA